LSQNPPDGFCAALWLRRYARLSAWRHQGWAVTRHRGAQSAAERRGHLSGAYRIRPRASRAGKQPDLARGHSEKARLAASDQQAAAMVAKVVNALSRLW